MTHVDYRDILRQVHIERMRVNPHYSLRAFARDLSLSQSQLSLILNKKKGLSLERAKKVFTSILVDPEILQNCLLQVQAEHARNKKLKAEAIKTLKEVSRDYDSITLTRDAFAVIANWYHFVILQAIVLKNSPKTYDGQISWLSANLFVSKTEINLAVKRMIRLELLTLVKNRLVVCHETVFTANGVPSAALRMYHRQIITKAIHSIETQSVKERVLNSGVFPMRKKDVGNFNEDLMRFQRTMLRKYGRVKENDGDCVYALSLQFFKVMDGKST